MKTTSLLPLATTLVIVLSFAGCGGGGDQPKTGNASVRKDDSADHQDSDSSAKKPRIGMTQKQIREMYGDPSNTSQTGDGEVWTYWFNKGHAFIPYNFGYRAKTGTFFFDSRGVLKNFDMTE